MTKLQAFLSFILIGVVGYHWHTSVWVNTAASLSEKYMFGGMVIALLGAIAVVMLHPKNQWGNRNKF